MLCGVSYRFFSFLLFSALFIKVSSCKMPFFCSFKFGLSLRSKLNLNLTMFTKGEINFGFIISTVIGVTISFLIVHSVQEWKRKKAIVSTKTDDVQTSTK